VTPRTLLLGGLVLAAAALSAPITATAEAAARPGQVGMVQVTKATTTSLHLQWPKTAQATQYIVEVATDEQLSDRRTYDTVTRNAAWVTGLAPGQVYCFDVIARNSHGNGPRSVHTCKPTISTQPQPLPDPPTYRVLTYNLCSRHCAHWRSHRAAAARLVRHASPDVVGFQEDTSTSGMPHLLKPAGLHQAVRAHGSALFFDRSRFRVVRNGSLDLRHQLNWGVWAIVADKEAGGRRLMFANAHVAAGGDTSANDDRRREGVQNLVEGVTRMNASDLPVVYLGDYNSYRHRQYDSPATVFHSIGRYDAFDLAESLHHPNYNSANGGTSIPRIGHTWGDHVDHVWVDPTTTRVLSWSNTAPLVHGRYSPRPSNHNPILVRIRLS
jgi:endonuclease/exonuclease/phosphatase family metal-dependent hydrolase